MTIIIGIRVIQNCVGSVILVVYVVLVDDGESWTFWLAQDFWTLAQNFFSENFWSFMLSSPIREFVEVGVFRDLKVVESPPLVVYVK